MRNQLTQCGWPARSQWRAASRGSLRPPRSQAGRLLGALAACLVACGGSNSAPPDATATATATTTASASPTPTATPIDAVDDALSGGATTVVNATANAFGQPARNLPLAQRTDFFVGNALFNRDWVIAPSSTQGSDGLGPVVNARSCSSCHFRDGRGRPPLTADEPMVSMLIRLSVPGTAPDGGPVGDMAYGLQLGPQAILGVPAEGRALVEYNEVPGVYGDGEPYSLRTPRYAFADLAFGPLDPAIRISPRTAPFLIGLGLLSAVDEATIVSHADPDDADGDGISGRPTRAWDRRRQTTVLGRFGWKASQPTLEQQNAGAFVGDIGITSPLFPDQECTAVQTACVAAPDGGEPEVDQDKLDAVTFYTHFLAVPARREVDDPTVRRGGALFAAIGCGACHLPTLVTGRLDPYPELSGQVIHPYSDLLLHDMGAGLADDRPDFEAGGREWRTPPLWGIGLIATVNRHFLLLHDGRARGVAEAILWHGGEGGAAREAFRALSAADRTALIRFLESL
jgi:CxxC motif-containing protein (DUF1111 family)